MKQEDYFKMLDGASEDDITEMMQHRRSRHIPADKEITMMKHTEYTGKKEIHMNRRSIAAGSAVAAALLALNVGGGYLLLHGRNTPGVGTDSASETEIVTDITENAVTDISEVVSEVQTTVTIDEEPMPNYAGFMQRYYEGLTMQPCDYDFTPYGMDLDQSWENDLYKITVRAVVGCDWVLYYFYDVETKPAYDELQGGADFPCVWFSQEGLGDSEPACMCEPMPGANSKEGEHIWHFYGSVTNTTDQPFFHQDGQFVPNTFTLSVHGWKEHDLFTEKFAECVLDFETPEYPLHALAQPQKVSDLTYYPEDFMSAWNDMGREMAFTMTQCAETPFGIYFVSDEYSAQGLYRADEKLGNQYGHGLSYDEAVQTDPADNSIRSFKTGYNTFYGLSEFDYRGMGFLNMLFRQPVNLEEGSVRMLFAEQGPNPEAKTGVNEDGLSYGPMYSDEEYDLRFVIGNNGEPGYVYADEFEAAFAPLQAADQPATDPGMDNGEFVVLNVYLEDGKTVVDTVTIPKFAALPNQAAAEDEQN